VYLIALCNQFQARPADFVSQLIFGWRTNVSVRSFPNRKIGREHHGGGRLDDEPQSKER
jgi:hypothetical protein